MKEQKHKEPETKPSSKNIEDVSIIDKELNDLIAKNEVIKKGIAKIIRTIKTK